MKEMNIVYRLGGGVTVNEINGKYEVRKNGLLTGTYSSLEKALKMQQY